ncbi:MAG: hypothetical protein Q9196_003848, partial [Gyalolechia fulgens]
NVSDLEIDETHFRTADSEDRKAAIDHHKNDQLNKQKDGKGHWKKELSSNSEAAVSYILSGNLFGAAGYWRKAREAVICTERLTVR